MNPYTEILEDNISYRVFSTDTPEEELVWHRDLEDRTLIVVEETDWMFQYDNEIPIPLSSSHNLFIPKDVYHRLIKGSNDLKVKIIKY